MPNTYVALRTETVATATNSVTFNLSGISGYTDLEIKANGTSSGDASFQIQFNGDTTSGLYSTTFMYGTGSSAVSGRSSNANFIVGMGRTNTTGGASIIQIQNYSNTTTFKTVIGRGSAAASLVIAATGLWRNTNAITSITITPEGSNTISVGSTFSLYGIANADQGAAKATGGIITEDSQYWYHTFGASGAFIPKQSLTCDVLVVAGGGSGSIGKSGTYFGPGGGAGQVLAYASQTVSTSKNVTVGAGGAALGSGTLDTNGNNGTVSTFEGLTSASVGGGGLFNTGTGGTSGNGFAGGSPSGLRVGGGGGAGSVGGNPVGSYSGVGGDGVNTITNWGSFANVLSTAGLGVSGFIGGGGGGSGSNPTYLPGAGGSGGGGRGAAADPAQSAGNGVANTGSGGGGGSYLNYASGAGGSGIVIIRYAK